MYPARAPAAGPCPAWYRLRWADLAAVLLLVLWSLPCAAQPTLRWRAPAECPKQAKLGEALVAHWGDAGAPPQLNAIDARVTYDARRGYALALSALLRERTVRRTLHARRCTELVDAAVWLITLLARPEHNDADALAGQRPTLTAAYPGERVEPEPGEAFREHEASTPTAAAAQPNEATAPRMPLGEEAAERSESAKALAESQVPDTETSRRAAGVLRIDATPHSAARSDLHARVSAFGGVIGGAGARAQGSIGLLASVSLGVMHTQLTLSDLLPSDERVADGRHVQLWSVAAGVAECALFGQKLRIGPCVGVELVRTAAHSKDFGHDIQRAILWGRFDAALRLMWPIAKSLELSVSGGVGTPITPRPRFTVAGVGAVASAASWSQEAQVGLIYVAR